MSAACSLQYTPLSVALGHDGASQSQSSPPEPLASDGGFNEAQPCYQCQELCTRDLQEALKTLHAFIDSPYYLRLLFFGEYRRLISLFDHQVIALEARLKLLIHSKPCPHRATSCAPSETKIDCSVHSADTTQQRHRTCVESSDTSRPKKPHHLRRHVSCPQFLPFTIPANTSMNPANTSRSTSSSRGALIGDIHINLNNVGNVWGTKYSYTEIEDHSTHNKSRGFMFIVDRLCGLGQKGTGLLLGGVSEDRKRRDSEEEAEENSSDIEFRR
ncbi:hypothetical protein BJ165DRAFT_1407135 [Panaeolus papilionaceus]|nr:hypothetical protein BJ165DRAFT_1407135 [Panaeolus papilionaceus]